MNQYTDAVVIRGIVQNYRKRNWFNKQCGGLAIRDKDEIVFAPTGQHYIQSSLLIGRQPLNCEFTNDLCAGLWKRGFIERGAEAIIHTSSTNGLAIAELNNEHISFENFERLNIMGPNYEGGRFQLSIINGNNLEQSLFECAEKSPAVLVRGHGLFVWGASWSQTIDRCEAIEALFEVHIKMFNHGRQPGQNMP